MSFFPFEGNNATHLIVPEFTTIPYSVNGFDFSATGATSTTGMAGTINLRNQATLTIAPVVRNSKADGKDYEDAMSVKFEADCWNTDYFSLKNFFLLTQTNVNFSALVGGLHYYNFVPNTANPPFINPNGSQNAGFTFQFDASPKDRTVKATFEIGRLNTALYDWVLAHTATLASATGVDGTNQGIVSSLSSMVYDNTNNHYAQAGIQYISVSGTQIGLFSDDAKITISTDKESSLDEFERKYSHFATVECDCKMLQVYPVDSQAVQQLKNQDFSMTAMLWDNTSLVFINSLSMVGAPIFSDDKAFVQVKFKGRIGYPAFNTWSNTPGVGNISFDDTNTKIIFQRSVYIPQ